MSEDFQIKRLILSQFQQFRFCDLSLTHPVSGEILKEVCLVGPNGTGKSTILAQLYHSIDPQAFPSVTLGSAGDESLILTQFVVGDHSVYQARSGAADAYANKKVSWFSDEIEQSPKWASLRKKPLGYKKFIKQFSGFKISRKNNPIPDSIALAFFSPQLALVDSSPAADFYDFINSCGSKRQEHYHAFLHLDENLNRQVAEVEADFESNFPDPLQSVKSLWNHILKDLSIEFDPTAQHPILDSRTGAEISFHSLSPGLQSYLLRIGLVYCQYFNAPDRSGFVFLDEPECGLSPRLAASLIQFFQPLKPERPGQLFVATHEDNVAEQFAPANLIQLQFDDEDGYVTPVPIEFELVPEDEDSDGDTTEPEAIDDEESTERRKKFSRYSQLKRQIRNIEDQDELADLIDEAMSFRKH
tara:strand:+ start:656 stop:1900 length:1245 start_codon:yes stop_codon:yes gene_type:complete